MKKLLEYYRGKPCKMDIGADGQIRWAVGRIVGEAEGAIPMGPLSLPSVVLWSTPHGSTFESTYYELYELDENDKIILKQYELEAYENEKVRWYGAQLDDVSFEILKL